MLGPERNCEAVLLSENALLTGAEMILDSDPRRSEITGTKALDNILKTKSNQSIRSLVTIKARNLSCNYCSKSSSTLTRIRGKEAMMSLVSHVTSVDSKE